LTLNINYKYPNHGSRILFPHAQKIKIELLWMMERLILLNSHMLELFANFKLRMTSVTNHLSTLEENQLTQNLAAKIHSRQNLVNHTFIRDIA
jgi:hypothetical protein